MKPIPVIDLFAGPGGLGEGFSSVNDGRKRAFDIKLSIEMDENAHQTLELRSFTRQFPIGQIPIEYYQLLQEPNLIKRTELRKNLFERYSKEAETAKGKKRLDEINKSLDLNNKRIVDNSDKLKKQKLKFNYSFLYNISIIFKY